MPFSVARRPRRIYWHLLPRGPAATGAHWPQPQGVAPSLAMEWGMAVGAAVYSVLAIHAATTSIILAISQLLPLNPALYLLSRHPHGLVRCQELEGLRQQEERAALPPLQSKVRLLPAVCTPRAGACPVPVHALPP